MRRWMFVVLVLLTVSLVSAIPSDGTCKKGIEGLTVYFDTSFKGIQLKCKDQNDVTLGDIQNQKQDLSCSGDGAVITGLELKFIPATIPAQGDDYNIVAEIKLQCDGLSTNQVFSLSDPMAKMENSITEDIVKCDSGSHIKTLTGEFINVDLTNLKIDCVNPDAIEATVSCDTLDTCPNGELCDLTWVDEYNWNGKLSDCSQTGGSDPDFCSDGTDNDGDGLTDCEDPECLGTSCNENKLCIWSPSHNEDEPPKRIGCCQIDQCVKLNGICIDKEELPYPDSAHWICGKDNEWDYCGEEDNEYTNKAVGEYSEGTGKYMCNGNKWVDVIPDHTIKVKNNIFEPNDLNIGYGDTVRWEWVEGMHTVTSILDLNSPINTGLFDFNINVENPTSLYTFDLTEDEVTFNEGSICEEDYCEINYHCKNHFNDDMKGTIYVRFDSDGDGVQDDLENQNCISTMPGKIVIKPGDYGNSFDDKIGCPVGDLNKDGIVNEEDLGLIDSNFGNEFNTFQEFVKFIHTMRANWQLLIA